MEESTAIILYDEKLLDKQKHFYKVKAKSQGKIVEIEEFLFSKHKNNAKRICDNGFVEGLCYEIIECFLV